MIDANQVNSGWEDCPSGKISAFTSRMNQRQRRHPVRWASVATLVVLSGLLAMQLSEASQSERQRLSNIGGISCSEVLSVVDRFIRRELDENLRRKVGFHLCNCPNCAKEVSGVAKKDLFQRLLSGNDHASSDSLIHSRPRGRNFCDDDIVEQNAVVRKPVLAIKVLATAAED